MKSQTFLLLLFLAAVSTWAACASGVPMVPAFVLPPADEPAAAELEEGLLELVAGGPEGELPTAEVREEALRVLRQAVEMARDGTDADAIEAFEAAGRLLPVFADWTTLLAARVEARSGEVAAVESRLAGLGDVGAGKWGWRVLYDAHVARGDSTAALGTAERAAPGLELPSERALAWAWAGAMRAATGNESGALRDFRSAMAEGTAHAGALAAARAAHDLPNLTGDDRLAIGRTLLAHGGLDRGIPMLAAYSSATGTDPAAAAGVRLEVGRVLFNARRYDDAVAHLRSASGSLPEATYLLGRSLYRLGRQDQGVQTFLQVARSHPASEAAADALFLVGDLAHDDGRTDAAAEYYRQTVATGVHNTAAADAAVRLAGISILARDPRRASDDLATYLAARPRDAISAPALYWLGRAQLESGDADAAERTFREVLDLDPFSYYGMLAAQRLEASLSRVDLPDPPPADAAGTDAVEIAFFRIDILGELGLNDEAQLELARVEATVAQDPAALYAVAEAMSRHGQPIAGALLGRRLRQERGAWDDRLLRIVYQFPFRELVVREAERHSIDPFVVAGLIRQESFFNPVAVSAAGAIGLMQVMPTTAAGLASRAGIRDFNPSMLRDPETNLRLGTLFLADQMGRWNGRLADVFAAYNAGPNRVARWVQYPEHRDDEIYVERIPIAETRDYVKRLRLNEAIYRRLYSAPE